MRVKSEICTALTCSICVLSKVCLSFIENKIACISLHLFRVVWRTLDRKNIRISTIGSQLEDKCFCIGIDIILVVLDSYLPLVAVVFTRTIKCNTGRRRRTRAGSYIDSKYFMVRRRSDYQKLGLCLNGVVYQEIRKNIV